MPHHEEKKPATGDPQKDRVLRPDPSLEPVEGDEEIIEESLRQKGGSGKPESGS